MMTDRGSTLATMAQANAVQSLAALRVGTITAIGARIVISNIMEQLPREEGTRKDISANSNTNSVPMPAGHLMAQNTAAEAIAIAV
jgi:hypothetical protein